LHLALAVVATYVLWQLTGCGGPAPPEGRAAGAAAIRVPPGFIVEQVAGPMLTSYPTFGAFDHRGRLFICESSGPNTMTTEEMLKEPRHRVRLLQDLDGDGRFDRSTVFADRIPFAAGVLWHQGSLFVAAPPDLLRFRDADDDGVADEREVLLSGWTLNVNGATLNGPFLGPDGWLYLPDARRGYRITTREGTLLEGRGPRIWRVRPDGSELHWISAGGFDNPVELVFTPAGETIGTMTYFTDPKAGQRDALMHWVEGGVYPKPHRVVADDRLKLTGDLMPVMTRFAAVAPAGLLRYRSAALERSFEGNLFSAQFNTHRVVRHVLSRLGATFRTTDETFLASSDPDFHPTDVLEDADGSLVVIDTGGWFIKGCPLSRVAKPQVRGAVYRIRRATAVRPRDPWAPIARLSELTPSELAERVEDANPFVRDEAIELLGRAGAGSVGPLAQALGRSRSIETRCRAVFALSHLAVPEARERVRLALDAAELDVRIAAARAVGLARDQAAVPRLLQMVRDDEPAARRQAATALEQIGQIGAPHLVGSLAAAAAVPGDRFVEHAIIHALIALRDPDPLLRALGHASTAVRRMALVALDQMDGSPLAPAHLRRFLSAEPALRHAALWVAAHHPQWSQELVAFLEPRLRDVALTGATREMLAEPLAASCGQPGVQRLVARLLADPSVGTAARLFLLEAVERCDVPTLSAELMNGVVTALGDRSSDVRLRAVAVARARSLAELRPRLDSMANAASEPPSLRVAALGALVTSRPELAAREFEFLLAQLADAVDLQEQLRAADVLVAARLDDSQLLAVTRRTLPSAGPFVRARVIEAFEDSTSAAVGEALVAKLVASPHGLDTFELAPLERLLGRYPPAVQRSAERLFGRLRARREERIRKLTELERALAEGDIERGRSVFFSPKTGCFRCHTVGPEGGAVGPDLTAVGAIRSRHDLLEAIIFPSASFVRDYEVYRVETARDVHVGVVREQRRDAVVLVTGAATTMTIPRSAIVKMEPSKVSLMPEGLDEGITRTELADLIAFLEARR
jgi:putative membrane-bound dehydrogenase-like protein